MLGLIFLLSISPIQDTLHLRVLSINDLHGTPSTRTYSFSEGRLVGGVAVLAATMDSAEAECNCVTIRVAAGDLMQGTLQSNVVYGKSIIEALNALELDVAAIGNHEFDWGVDSLKARMEESRFPWLAANVFYTDTGERPEWARPYTILEAGGIRIGIVGYITSSTPTIVRPIMVEGLSFVRGAESLADILQEVRTAGVDFTIIVGHAATFCNDDRCGESIQLAEELSTEIVDLIVGGHDHRVAATEANGIPVVEAWSNGRAVGVVDLYKTRDGSVSHSMHIDTTYADAVQPNPAVVAVMSEYESLIDSMANRTITTLEHALPRDGSQYALGNLFADAIRAGTGADVGLTNNGGIRADLDAGTVTYGELFQVHPFGNLLSRVTVTGAELIATFEHSLMRGRPRVHISGATVTYDSERPAGERVVEVRLSSGEVVDPAASYILAVPDFVAQGGDGFPLSELPRETLNADVLDSIIALLQSDGSALADLDRPRMIDRVAPSLD